MSPTPAVQEAPDAAREASSSHLSLGPAQLNEGAALYRSGHLGDAVACYWVATTLASSRNAAASHLSLVLSDPRCQGAASPPEVGLVQRLLTAPDDVLTMRRLGTLQLQKKRWATAIGCFERALELAPSATAYHELGALFWGLGQAQLAQARFLRAFECADVDVHTYGRLEAWLSGQPGFSVAGPCWRAILERCPDHVATLVNWGVTLQLQRLPSEAERLHRRALRLDPNCLPAHINLGSALCDQGRFPEASAVYRRGQQLDPLCAQLASNLLFSLHFDPSLSPETILAEHVQFGQRFGEALSRHARSFVRDRDPERPLRIGYVSADFRSHPVADFLEPVLAAHDRRAVEVYAYSDAPCPDAVTARLAGLVSHFIPCAGWPDAQLAERIRADPIDILVDLAGHTGNNRLLVFARKPSPIQVSWLGYFDTTGLTAIDYRIADEHSVPEAAERFFVERIVRLPRSANCFLHPESPEPAPAPCLRRGHVTLGCFNNPAKVTRGVVATFARILSQLPASRLILKYGTFDDPVLRDQYLRWFAEEGIAPGRIDLQGHSALPEFLASFAHIDVALDPFPHSGETTALHTLWMGVPLVALEGVTLVQRLASRVLRVAGLKEWVAHTTDEYVAIALSLARDPERLSSLRAGLRDRLKASPLLDHAGVTRELEAAYRKMWRRWCAAQ
jgi:protein O-GlcNAc transferase